MSQHLYYTAELRWFVPAEAGRDQLLRWFRLDDQLPLREEGRYESATASEPFVKLEQERTDLYLLLPDVATASVKQRQGRLEVKALVSGPHPVSLGPGAGQVDQWVKWSFEASATLAPQMEAELGQAGLWREVTKRRYLQQVALDSGKPVPVSPDLYLDAGCHVELTLVSFPEPSGSWLTLGFEAFGPRDQNPALLVTAARHFFATCGAPPIRLVSRESLSYPAWLARLPRSRP